MPNIAFVTTCKGRLHHLQQTLPLLVAQAPEEIVVVDYGCPDQVGDWVAENYPEVIVVRVNDDPGFCAARARNLGARKITSDWICFIDADVLVRPGWVEWMRGHLSPGFYYRAGPNEGVRVGETWGSFICPRRAFEMAEGYDEVFRGWGGEDDDLYSRLKLLGLVQRNYPPRFVEPIRHADDERLAYYEIKDRKLHYCANRFYLEAKRQIMSIQPQEGHPPLATRQAIMNQVQASFLNWPERQSKGPPEISFTMAAVGWLPRPYRMLKKCSFTLTMDEIRDSTVEEPPSAGREWWQ